MKRSERIEKIVRLNRNFETMAGATFSKAQNDFQQKMQQLEQLNLYRDEYQERLKERLKSPINAQEMRDYQFFFNSLDYVISEQLKIVKDSEIEVEKYRDEWLDKKNEVNKFTRLADNCRRTETKANEKKLLRENDELNQMRHKQKHFQNR